MPKIDKIININGRESVHIKQYGDGDIVIERDTGEDIWIIGSKNLIDLIHVLNECVPLMVMNYYKDENNELG